MDTIDPMTPAERARETQKKRARVKHIEKKGVEVYRAERRAYTRKRRAASRLRMWEWLSDKNCVDCLVVTDPRCLEFDHVRGDKSANVAEWVATAVAWHRIMEEVAKCEVVCANCHRIRTSVRGGWHIEQYLSERN